MNMKENNIQTPGFSKFRELLDLWDKQLIKEADESSIRSFLGANNLLLFFIYVDTDQETKKKVKTLYGTDENERILFSRMKDPKERKKIDNMEVFTAIDLKKAMKSSAGVDDENKTTFKRGFNKNSIQNIKVVDEDYVVEKLKNYLKTNPKVEKGSDEVILSDDQ